MFSRRSERKSSYTAATQLDDEPSSKTTDPIYCLSSPSRTSYEEVSTIEKDPKQFEEVHTQRLENKTTSKNKCVRPSMYKNLAVLSLSFLLMFTSFRPIQNLQTSFHSARRYYSWKLH